jgi:hypothetical protein
MLKVKVIEWGKRKEELENFKKLGYNIIQAPLFHKRSRINIGERAIIYKEFLEKIKDKTVIDESDSFSVLEGSAFTEWATYFNEKFGEDWLPEIIFICYDKESLEKQFFRIFKGKMIVLK